MPTDYKSDKAIKSFFYVRKDDFLRRVTVVFIILVWLFICNANVIQYS